MQPGGREGETDSKEDVGGEVDVEDADVARMEGGA